MIKLGDKVKDKISGFTGIAVGKTEWLYGCVRFALSPQKLKDGKLIAMEWFDEQQLEIVKKDKLKVSKQLNKTKPAGPRNDPTRRESK